jgi:hypothetical protein
MAFYGDLTQQVAQQAAPDAYAAAQQQAAALAAQQQASRTGVAPQDVLSFFKTARQFDRYTDAQGYNWMRDLQGGGGMGDSTDGGTMTANGFRRSLNPGENVGQGETTNLYYDPAGAYTHDAYDAKGWLNPLTGILAVAGFGLGAQALAAGAAGGGAGATTFGVVDEAAGALSAAGYGGGGAGTAAMGAGAGGYAGPTTFGVVDEAAGALSAAGGGAAAAPMTTFGVVDEAAGALSAAGGAGGAGAAAPSWLQQAGGAASSVAGGGGSGNGSLPGGMKWQDLAGIGAQLYNGYQGANAAENASAAQLQSAREAMALTAPWREKGVAGLNKLSVMLGLEGQGSPEFGQLVKDFQFTQDDPSYQWRMNQGLKGLKNSYAGKGKFLSGAAMKGINDYAQGAASQEYGASFNRDLATRTNLYNRLAGIAGTGQTASNTMGEYGTQAGNAQAAGEIGQANSWGNALSGAYNTYTQNQLMNQLLARR